MSDDVVIRQARPADMDACSAIEAATFPADEAASPDRIEIRQRVYPQGFIVGERDGEVIGYVMSCATRKPDIADEELKEMIGHDPGGENLVVLSIAVRPDLQDRRLGGRLMEAFLELGRTLEKKRVLLLCKDDVTGFYERYGFVNAGPSASTHGGAQWFEMRCEL